MATTQATNNECENTMSKFATGQIVKLNASWGIETVVIDETLDNGSYVIRFLDGNDTAVVEEGRLEAEANN